MAHPISSEINASPRVQTSSPPGGSCPRFTQAPAFSAPAAKERIEPAHYPAAHENGNAAEAIENKSASATALERWLCKRLLRTIGGQSVGIVLWNGEEISLGERGATIRLLLRDRPTLYQLLFDPDWEFGEAYSDGRLEIAGGLRELLEIFYRGGQNRDKRSSPFARSVKLLRHWRRANSIAGSRKNIRHHYDLGNDFYRLWLDERMVYSCAYFAEPSMTLERAQRAKLDYVCRKLGLQSGEAVAEVGGGWGALALHIAEHYGCRVKSFNISREQIEYARQRVREEGLDDRVEIVEDDYRNITGRFDALVSLGMLEHVGREHYLDFGKMAHRCLAPHGRALVQTIGQNRPLPHNPWIERRIFPGGHLPTLREFMEIVEPWNFSVADVENLRLHYAKTLECWLARFEASAENIRRMFDDRFVRMWRLYLTGSAAAFAAGALQLFQILFTRGERTKLPWTRAEWYRQGESRGEI
ncbi:MAG: class I SAM-dependent methyltransferase [Pirellulales bacterium]|nr:class I SAM-dependent methyltransferase [Pirellulales bacterium]